MPPGGKHRGITPAVSEIAAKTEFNVVRRAVETCAAVREFKTSLCLQLLHVLVGIIMLVSADAGAEFNTIQAAHDEVDHTGHSICTVSG